jgi:hypothetical protein
MAVSAQSNGQELTFSFEEQNSLWNNVWENLNTVESNTKEQMKYNETLSLQLETLSQQLKDKETAYAYQSLLLKNSEEALKKSNNTVIVWRTTSIVLTVSLVGTITTLIIVLCNK